MQCSKPHIWAVGDVAETLNPILGTPQIVPLAGPANLQGRIIADNIMHPEKLTAFTGGLGTAIARVFSLAAASTGLNEKQIKKTSLPYQAVFVHPNSHAGYYPGAHPIALKLLFRSDTGEILGAQAVGKDGVDKRIDVIATAIRGKLTVDDLCDLELSYAPPFGSAKDAVQIAAMAAQNVMRGLVAVAHPWSFNPANHSGILLDVRDDDEVSRGTLPTARHIPLSQLRERLHELPKDQEIVVYCQSGMRSYLAARILAEHGYRCRNLSGAFKSWSVAHTSRAA
jgi:rhodanese-related sulfurtransferase